MVCWVLRLLPLFFVEAVWFKARKAEALRFVCFAGRRPKFDARTQWASSELEGAVRVSTNTKGYTDLSAVVNVTDVYVYFTVVNFDDIHTDVTLTDASDIH